MELTPHESPPVVDADLLIRGGRVVDPRSGRDGVADVAVRDGRIVAVGTAAVQATTVVEAQGLTVVPGFIDLHSHAQTPLGLMLQAFDGVTSALDLEAGALPIPDHYADAEREGRPIGFGFSACWASARLHVMDGVPLRGTGPSGRLLSSPELVLRNQRSPRWQHPASARERTAVIGAMSDALEAGALGIGMLLGYCPGAGRNEVLDIARLAAAAGVTVFVHVRYMSNAGPASSLDAITEMVDVAAETGVHLHVCHVNSTSLRLIDDVMLAIERARAQGGRITTEAYPYTTSSTGIGAAFLDPAQLWRLGIEPDAITYLPTGRRVRDATELALLRERDPGGLCLIDYLDERVPADERLVTRSFQEAGTVVASDAMPLVDASGAYVRDAVKLLPGMHTHPRSVGTFARTFGRLVRERSVLTLHDAVLRTSTLPAEMLAPFVPQMQRKGRIAVGFDADITVLDERTITDRGSFAAVTPSTGIEHVFVGGRPVVRRGAAGADLAAGRSIRR
ncbi:MULTISPECIES: amidohydrolase family protein [unclassified Microbacterium]|uniref:amidohydrolase family protein n=1 Tax=unclassified Microbacterium TaxID=2609290 RepID=UPI00301B5C9B